MNYACLSICTYLYDDDSLILDSRSHITYPVDGQNSEVRLAYLRCLSTWEVSYVVVVAVVFVVVVVAVVVAAVGAAVGGAVVAVVVAAVAVVVVVAHVFTMLVTSIFEGELHVSQAYFAATSVVMFITACSLLTRSLQAG